ncbi:hypothetical protein ABZ901_15850 [Actinacidiphila alni]|uniref:hypothetical protein n=1 Tax=Actinacidiphila alni TaxID=380248 RepID=UPI0033D30DA9
MSPDPGLSPDFTRLPHSCPVCLGQFHPDNPRQVYCSPVCKQAARRSDPAELAAHTCPVCQTEFTANPRMRQVYCSPDSRRDAENQRNRDRNHERARRLADQQATTLPARAADPLQPAAVRNCPHCDQPVTIVALLATPEAARPTIHQPGSDIIALRRI